MIGEVLGNYRITDQIGKGGMGIVYAAEHILLGKRAAIKVLKPERCESSEVVDRFFNEARAASMVKAPGIPEIFDYGRLPQGNAYLVMELLEGETLGDLLDREVRLTPGRALAMARHMAGTFKATHAHGIIHRDLKPDNVYVVPDPAMPRGERIKILDFGIAKLQHNDDASSVQTETGRLMGTPFYMSPEQCRGAGDIDHRTDIYSLGCVLYQMLCGRPPFALKGSGEVLAAHIHLEAQPVSAVESRVPAELDVLTMRLLSKDPEERPQTMQAVIDALNDIAASAGLVAPEASLAASKETPLGLELDTIDDFQAHKNTTTMEASSGEYLTPSKPTATELIVKSGFVRRIVAPLAVVGGLVFGAWGAWTVLDNQTSSDQENAASQRSSDLSLSPGNVESPIIVRELVEVPAEVDYVSLAIESSPSGARVYRESDGVEVGRTPLQVKVQKGKGSMTFLLRKTGYRGAKIALPVAVDGKKRIKMEARVSGAGSTSSDLGESKGPAAKASPEALSGTTTGVSGSP